MLAPDSSREVRTIIRSLLSRQATSVSSSAPSNRISPNRSSAFTKLSPAHFIQPVFLVEGKGILAPSNAIPQAKSVSIDKVTEFAREVTACGIRALLLFGIPRHRKSDGSTSLEVEGLIPRATQLLKEHVPELTIFADVCVCQYTPEGHCGLILDGKIDTERTLHVLTKQSLLLARSGVDVLMPSGMTPGIVKHLRQALDATGHYEVAITNQSVKFASSFFGPFQSEAFHLGELKDKRSYQVPCNNTKEALREISEDLYEYGDMVVVKPAFGYQDIIYRARKMTTNPIVAVITSGEHLLLEETAKQMRLSPQAMQQRVSQGLLQAGADFIVSYFAESWSTQSRKVTELSSRLTS